jgi:hypothetical protein
MFAKLTLPSSKRRHIRASPKSREIATKQTCVTKLYYNDFGIERVNNKSLAV